MLSQTRTCPKSNLAFTNFQRELFARFESGTWCFNCERLLEKFAFSSAENKGILYPWNGARFLRLLREKGIITPSNITQFTSALTSINSPSKTITKIEESFEVNINKWLNVPPYLKDKIDHFVNGLKSQYKRRYLSVRLIPFNKGGWRSVNDVFVETNIEKFHFTIWRKVSSHHEITSALLDSRLVVISSDPGYGKSILLQQLAYDWCTSSPESPLQFVTVFILIRLKELQGVKCIYDAIKSLLPLETILTSSDIRDILTSGEVYVVFAFDGFDEYPDADGGDNDINSVINGKMFSSLGVVVTTRRLRLHDLQQTPVTEFRLTGFEPRMQEIYLEKALAKTTEDREKIMLRIQESDMLKALCEVPFFFAIVSPVVIDTASTQNARSVTQLLTRVITDLFTHLERKVKTDSPSPAMINEESQGRLLLAKIAYDGLVNTPSKLIWTDEEIVPQLGPFYYDLYVRTGVLLNEEKQAFVGHPGSHVLDHASKQTNVYFSHTTIQEYYAATCLVRMSRNISETDFKDVLQKIHAHNFHYLCRFVCGLDSIAAKLVMDYLRGMGKDERMLAILCVLEQQGEGIEDIITELCKTQIALSPNESILVQRAKIQLLQTASKLKIAINKVCLGNCLMSSNVEDESLYLYSGLSVPILDTLRELRIFSVADLRNQTAGIIHFALKCERLRKLILDMDLFPRMVFSENVIERIRRQGCEVLWFYDGQYWSLDTNLKKWKNKDGEEMRHSAYYLRNGCCSNANPYWRRQHLPLKRAKKDHLSE